MDEFLRQRIELDKLVNTHIRSVGSYYKTALLEVTGEVRELMDRFTVEGALDKSRLMRLGNLERFYEKIQAQMSKSMTQGQTYLRKALPDFYTEAFQRSAFAQEKTFGVDLGSGRPNEKMVRTALSGDWSKLRNAQALELDRKEAFWRVKNQITTGILRGETSQDVSRRIGNMLGLRQIGHSIVPIGGGEMYKAARIARTEMGRLATQAQLDRYQQAKDLGLEIDLIWVATLDNRSRPEHGAIDQEPADDDGYWTFPDGVRTQGPGTSGDPYHDINCRCTTTERLKGTMPSTRSQVVTGEDGVQRGVIGQYKSFEDWKNGKTLSVPGNEVSTVIPVETPEGAFQVIHSTREEMEALGSRYLPGSAPLWREVTNYSSRGSASKAGVITLHHDVMNSLKRSISEKKVTFDPSKTYNDAVNFRTIVHEYLHLWGGEIDMRKYNINPKYNAIVESVNDLAASQLSKSFAEKMGLKWEAGEEILGVMSPGYKGITTRLYELLLKRGGVEGAKEFSLNLKLKVKPEDYESNIFDYLGVKDRGMIGTALLDSKVYERILKKIIQK